MNPLTLRRDLMRSALISSLPAGFLESAAGSPLNPEQTSFGHPQPTAVETESGICRTQCGQLRPGRRSHAIGPVLHPDPLVAGVHERTAPLYH